VATKTIAEWCSVNNTKLVYISTDYVFDGKNPPYNETSEISPVNIYGKTKAAGESYVRNVPNHIIARIPLQYGFSVSGEDSLISKIIASDIFNLHDSEILPTDEPVKQFAPRPLNSHLSTKLYDSMNLYKFHTFREGLEIIKNKMNC